MDPEPATSLQLSLQFASRTTGLPTAAQLRRWARAAVATPVALTLRIVDSREGRKLNRAFRQRDYPTNVLTFVYGTTAGILQGDIVLCAPVVKREAREQGKPLAHHYAHLLVHGLLHLQGYDHERKTDARRMESQEIGILEQLHIPDPYLDRN